MTTSSNTAANCTIDSFQSFFTCGAGAALDDGDSTTVHSLAAAIAGSFISLGAQLLIFLILRLRLSRIYRPKSYLVPERERLPPPPGGLVGWIYPLFTTTNLTLIQKCGLDAYFFLRFLRMLLKIFLPAALIMLPILLPINKTGDGGKGGLNVYSISNIGPKTVSRLWAHCILAVIFIGWFFYVIFKELRGYVRVRQAFLTSPQHRIRASATTVLVTGIPPKWLTLEALSGLYDVFPGGIRNIWINRNFDELSDKVKKRDDIAKSLEDAETSLIKLCRKKHAEAEKKKAKKMGHKKTKQEREQAKVAEDAAAEQTAHGEGVSAGERHELSQGIQEAMEEGQQQHEAMEEHPHHPFGVVTGGLGAVGHGLGAVGQSLGKLGGRVAGGVDSGFHKAGDDLNRAAQRANDGGLSGGFVVDDSLYGPSPGQEAFPQLPPRAAHGEKSSRSTTTRMETSARETRAVSPALDNNTHDSPTSDRTLDVPGLRVTRPSAEWKPESSLQIEEPEPMKSKHWSWNIFQNHDNSLALPSPQPHVVEEDEFPLHAHREKHAEKISEKEVSKSKWTEKLQFWKSDAPEETYPDAFNKDWDEDQDEEPAWRRYIEPKDRETMRLPLFCPSWFPGLPLVGKKVDRIYHLRRELARLNLEIEADQDNVDKFPLMNSAFIQFNHQVAAHMCCQSLSHHVPRQMAPRLVEISPDDVIWDNMAIKWWERYLRTGIVLGVCAGLIVLYAIPVTFTSLLNNVGDLAQKIPGLKWLAEAPPVALSIIQGILPAILLSVILLLVPIIFRALIKQQGVPTGNAQELGVQAWYFAFLFIQVFLVVTLTNGLINFFTYAASDPGSIVRSLATNLPKASNYFFSYLTVQALSNSASALLQVLSLIAWFVLAPLIDSTARAKWRRQTNLNNVQWGSFFPPFTNFAVIGLIYSVLAPLMLVFMLFIFALFWIVNRYNVLFVFQFRQDTGGLLFPAAINQLFVGLYFLELCLIGIFFTYTGTNGYVDAIGEGVIMVIVLIATIVYQWVLNMAFQPLFQYLPITLEDEAVIRDEQFAKAQASKFAPLNEGGEDARDIQDVLEDREREENEGSDASEDGETPDAEKRRQQSSSQSPDATRNKSSPRARQSRWHRRMESTPVWNTDKWKAVAPEAVNALRFLADGKRVDRSGQDRRDPESQHTVGDVLFSGYADELEDLSPEDRDLLVRYAFQHGALRARRPVVWIPRDALGVSDDEIKRAKKMSTVDVPTEDDGKEEKTLIWMSNEGTALDHKGRVVFRRSPPDFSNVDLIAL